MAYAASVAKTTDSTVAISEIPNELRSASRKSLATVSWPGVTEPMPRMSR